MLVIRPARWSAAAALLAGLDTSFATDRIYRVIRDELEFRLAEEKIDSSLRKDHSSVADDDTLREMDYALVAERDGELVGFAAAEFEAWNRRLIVRHLYVAARCRGSGIGRALLDHLDTFARSAGARCLWLDTPNVNYPAIQFYRHMGFRLCGLDESLYDPAGPGGNEVALFFVRELT
jgi:ribosomal protein S18 acetylase RimI-like enzyme